MLPTKNQPAPVPWVWHCSKVEGWTCPSRATQATGKQVTLQRFWNFNIDALTSNQDFYALGKTSVF